MYNVSKGIVLQISRPRGMASAFNTWHHDFYITVLSGIKQVNVELEPGFQTNEQKRDNGRCSSQYLI